MDTENKSLDYSSEEYQKAKQKAWDEDALLQEKQNGVKKIRKKPNTHLTPKKVKRRK